MVDLEKGYISQAIFYSAHAADNRMRYRQEEAESTFGQLFNVQSQQTNVPDDFDPAAPRLIFQAPHKQFLLSKKSTQLVLGFEGANKPISAQIDIVVDNIQKVIKKLPLFVDCTGEVGFILSFNFPSSESRSEMSQAVFNKFLKMPENHAVASSSVKVGFQTSDFLFLNLEVDVYESRRGLLQSNGLSVQSVDISTLEFHEAGYSFKVDINNKPKIESKLNYSEESEGVVVAMKNYMRDSFDDFVRF